MFRHHRRLNGNGSEYLYVESEYRRHRKCNNPTVNDDDDLYSNGFQWKL